MNPMTDLTLHPSLLISELLEACPQCIPVFLHHHMSCVGCSFSSFETLAEAARNYQLPLEQLLRELASAIG
jgi:hybrid cluster-associated redox disulfide protein